MDEAVIVAACRTPIGKFQGALSDFSAPQLGAVAIKEALKRAHVDGKDLNEVIMGNVITAGIGQNPARQAMIYAGVPVEVPAFSVNKVCGSSLKAVMLAAQAIKAGDATVILAGGRESMTNAPYLLPKARAGLRLGNAEMVDSLIHDGLWDVYNKFHMGVTGEIVAKRHDVRREDADKLALESHKKAQQATDQGKFKAEMAPVEVIDPKTKQKSLIDKDEGIRPQTTLESLVKLKPVFQADGMVTAGNSSQISDGGSAVVVMSRKEADRRGLKPLARILGYDATATKPEWVMEAPIPSVQNLFKKTHTGIDQVDLFEHNEAFATASCAVRSQLHVPPEKFNVHGGAVALGHPIGASGTRVLTTLLYALHDRKKNRGVATLCLGGGSAVSMLVERV
ncbi:MAG TPA: thiolase family protein [Candidatus Thermoplasmatota archaeon]|nr:thiolase family protein [Candidatus Thermoplasmatota archaeon]